MMPEIDRYISNKKYAYDMIFALARTSATAISAGTISVAR